MTPAQTQPCNFMSPIQPSTKFSLQKLKLTATEFFGISGQLLCMTVVCKVVKLLYVITKQEAGKLQSQRQNSLPHQRNRIIMPKKLHNGITFALVLQTFKKR